MIPGRFLPALRGFSDAVRTDPALRFHVGVALLVILGGFLACLSASGWALLFTVIGGVLSAELLNSALEAFANHVHPKPHDAIRVAKDLAAAAVLASALTSVFVGLLLFLPPLLSGTAGSCLL